MLVKGHARFWPGTMKRSGPLKRAAIKRRRNKNEIPQASRDAVALRSRDRCEYTGDGKHNMRCTRIGTDLHHIEKRRGRNHEPDNLLNLCRIHHGFIHAEPAWSYEYGYMVRMGGVND